MEAASGLLDRLESLAELLDDWTGTRSYTTALKAQKKSLAHGVPSTRVLEAMRCSGLGHRDWVMEMSLRHQQTMRAEAMAPDVQEAFRAMSRDSLAEQARMEAHDSQPFEQFLADYLRS